jgi:hypothetical protein
MQRGVADFRRVVRARCWSLAHRIARDRRESERRARSFNVWILSAMRRSLSRGVAPNEEFDHAKCDAIVEDEFVIWRLIARAIETKGAA